MLKRAAVLGLVFLSTCAPPMGTGGGDGATDGDGSGSNGPTDQTGRRTFSGDLVCESALIVVGGEDTSQDTYAMSITLGPTDLIVVDDAEVAFGSAKEDSFGAIATSGSVARIETGGSTVIEVEGTMSFCAYGCALNDNGQCDEPTDCVSGTDCSDCGPYALLGTATFSYQLDGDDRMTYTVSVTAGDADIDSVRFRLNCEGVLTP